MGPPHSLKSGRPRAIHLQLPCLERQRPVIGRVNITAYAPDRLFKIAHIPPRPEAASGTSRTRQTGHWERGIGAGMNGVAELAARNAPEARAGPDRATAGGSQHRRALPSLLPTH